MFRNPRNPALVFLGTPAVLILRDAQDTTSASQKCRVPGKVGIELSQTHRDPWKAKTVKNVAELP